MDNLRKKRESLGLTLKDVSEKIGVHFATISDWELGRKEPRPKNKIKLANLFNCSVEDLTGTINDPGLFIGAELEEKNKEENFPPSPFAKYRGELMLGANPVDCYVLDNGDRVISMSATVRAIANREHGKLGDFIENKAIKPYINNELVLGKIVEFHIPGIQFIGKGLPAEIFLDICNGYVTAFAEGALKTTRQKEIAMRCSVLLAACAKVGLIALIDEATGYQYERAENSLQLKLKAFIADEMRGWEKTFPDDLWEQFGRLTNWKGSLHSRPKWWGKLVMELIYNALDADVAAYLKENKPPPVHKKNYHQWLSEHYGLKQLITHIYEIIGMAKTCKTIKELQQKVGYYYRHEPRQLSLFDSGIDV
jgi:transcriptional regulator with XRE-family HTH domain